MGKGSVVELSLLRAEPASLPLTGPRCKTCDNFNLDWSQLGLPGVTYFMNSPPRAAGRQCSNSFKLGLAKAILHCQEVPETLRCLDSHCAPLPTPTGMRGAKPAQPKLCHTQSFSLPQV